MSRKKPEHLRAPSRKVTHLLPETRLWRAAAWNEDTKQLWLRINTTWHAFKTTRDSNPYLDDVRPVITGNIKLKGHIAWLN